MLNEIKRLENVFIVEDIKIFEKLIKMDDFLNHHISICNDKVISLNDIESIIYTLEDLITDNFLCLDFRKLRAYRNFDSLLYDRDTINQNNENE